MALEACASMAVSFVPARNVGPLLPQEKTRVLSRQRFRIRGLSAASEQPDVPPSTHVQENQLPGGGENFGSPKSLLASILSRNDDLKSQLRRYGTAGILSYGVFNTMYYLGTFLFFWFYVAPSPGGLGYAAAAQRFVRVYFPLVLIARVRALLHVSQVCEALCDGVGRQSSDETFACCSVSFASLSNLNCFPFQRSGSGPARGQVSQLVYKHTPLRIEGKGVWNSSSRLLCSGFARLRCHHKLMGVTPIEQNRLLSKQALKNFFIHE
ncbi:uncharacterized protein LOC9650887 isoform X1 [Selaginella moellendorffii]|uniref:uncharacterized protein LOC9650887 isoform X1 n=1 Tax=Selaginella moellendorffii TaxID=88036 RepID=UPI000D1C7312|nr:uncharacterized protein LOC9650887 isoform X1 [Selaginella moellendorffii]XP_024533127.1 uncharacterized protein LOC9650887 isoform X1 [Selaginella moellendorffii]|eukprot:XP_024533126.1 uncharacterized protein LOC9650887 isoform X1 [Selaginella moellendorffii]